MSHEEPAETSEHFSWLRHVGKSNVVGLRPRYRGLSTPTPAALDIARELLVALHTHGARLPDEILASSDLITLDYHVPYGGARFEIEDGEVYAWYATEIEEKVYSDCWRIRDHTGDEAVTALCWIFNHVGEPL